MCAARLARSVHVDMDAAVTTRTGDVFPLSIKTWETVYYAKLFQLSQDCYVEAAKAVGACARALEVMWYDPPCVSWFPYDFEQENILVISAYKGLGGKRDRDERRQVVAEIDLAYMYVDD